MDDNKGSIEKLAENIYNSTFYISPAKEPRKAISESAMTSANLWPLFQKAFRNELNELESRGQTNTDGLYKKASVRYAQLKRDEILQQYLEKWLNPDPRKGRFIQQIVPLLEKSRLILKQSINDFKRTFDTHGMLDKSEEEIENDVFKLNAHIEEVVSSIIDEIVKQMDLKGVEKSHLIDSLNAILRPSLYKSVGKTAMFENELRETAPAIIYQPGSHWVKTASREQFSQQPKELYKDVLRDLTKGRKKYCQTWRSFCSQAEELGKADLIKLVAEMDLPPYIQSIPEITAKIMG